LADPSHAICRFTPPCDERLCEILVAASRAVLREDPGLGALNVFDRGTVIQSRSGRFETAAEIAEYARAGADIVTHNIVTEIVFAKQLGLHFAPLHLVSNPAEGVAPWTFESISELYLKMNPVCWSIIESAIPQIAAIPTDAPRTLDRQRAHPPLSYREALARAKAT
jgi:5'-methylthioadenosine phosphorylase